ncbi:MAG: FHA domain-containing protein [Deltaproteobacteria bacterium]|nr:FHA domain-containing protein [Deltaproteobacteria bacterium]
MARVFLHYKGEYVHLPDGETVVGRDLACRLRFNDPAVSRRHFKILVEQETAVLVDLGSTNGTKLNRKRVKGDHKLTHRDKIQVGARELTVYFLDEDDAEIDPEVTTLVERVPDPPPPEKPRRLKLESLVSKVSQKQTCSQCGAEVDPTDEVCRTCGYNWSDFRAHSPTKAGQQASGAERRRHPRQRIAIPVLYSSDTLEVQSVAKNLSLSGVFISSEFLDSVGTECRVLVLIDGGPAVQLQGRVSRVVQAGHPEGIPPGLGVEFETMDDTARHWLWRMLKHQGEQ